MYGWKKCYFHTKKIFTSMLTSDSVIPNRVAEVDVADFGNKSVRSHLCYATILYDCQPLRSNPFSIALIM